MTHVESLRRRPSAVNGDRATGTCPRCRTTQWADVSEPWERLDGHLYEWVTVHPHLHARTQRSTCRPKGYSRRATNHTNGRSER